jgi:hypothetical protein
MRDRPRNAMPKSPAPASSAHIEITATPGLRDTAGARLSAALFPACRGLASPAGLKVLLRFEYTQSLFAPLSILPSKRSEQGLAQLVTRAVRPDELGIYDKAFTKDPLSRT